MALEITWEGTYEYAGQDAPMTFKSMYISATGNIKGHGSDDNGPFTIEGAMAGKEVKFVKQYTGAHAVNYSGHIDNQGVIQGKWEIPGNCDGSFKLKTSGATTWSGNYQMPADGNQDHPMSFMLKSHQDRFYGIGNDDCGPFTIDGEFITKR